MKVKDLIVALQKLNPNAEVFIDNQADDSGLQVDGVNSGYMLNRYNGFYTIHSKDDYDEQEWEEICNGDVVEGVNIWSND